MNINQLDIKEQSAYLLFVQECYINKITWFYWVGSADDEVQNVSFISKENATLSDAISNGITICNINSCWHKSYTALLRFLETGK